MNSVVIFSGYNQRAVIAFLRTLVENNIDNYFIIASGENDTILKTGYKKKVLAIRKNKELDKNELLDIVKKGLNIYNTEYALISPSTEALNRFLLDNRKDLENNNWIIPLINKNNYQLISDKESFWLLCKNKSLPVPQLVELTKEYSIPYVAKPLHYQSSNGNIYTPILVQCKEEHDTFIHNYNVSDFSYQEFIDGQSFYLLFYFSRNGKIYKYSQENIAQQFGGKSIIAAISSNLHLSDICDQYIKLLNELDYYGFIMIELRKYNNTYYMIEANPRFWGPSQMYHDCGVSFFEEFLKDYHILEKYVEKKEINKGFYYWSGGVKGNILDGDKCVFFGDGLTVFKQKYDRFKSIDIYNRPDTLEIYESEKGE